MAKRIDIVQNYLKEKNIDALLFKSKSVKQKSIKTYKKSRT